MATTIHVGDCRAKLTELGAGTIQTCITSPPYFGLRDYGTSKWEGGSADCDHKESELRNDTSEKWKSMESGTGFQFRGKCQKCGATSVDVQAGLEATPEEYVTNMVNIFSEVRRVLRDDGTLWLNLGDSYANPSVGDVTKVGGKQGKAYRNNPAMAASVSGQQKKSIPDGLKPKDLVGIPWRVALALQADGWYLRSDIIWHKPNPMPESVTDRPTKAHEYLFLLSKSQRYYYDADAISEPLQSPPHAMGNINAPALGMGGASNVGDPSRIVGTSGKRNKRSVWTVTPKPYSGAHFATFPPDLILPCILAGCPDGGLVLDPFLGSGTTLMVARRLGRQGTGIELNLEYARMALGRINDIDPLFNSNAVIA